MRKSLTGKLLFSFIKNFTSKLYPPVKLWKLNLSREELAEIGSLIGSDIPFFIYGGTCLAMGRGEIIENIVSIQKKWLTLILLPIKIEQKTKRLYSFITPENYSSGNFTTKFIKLSFQK